MARIKVISNPYAQSIEYQFWNGTWTAIEHAGNPSSRLLGDEFTSSFFPFKVHDILCEIIDEYHADDDRIELVFEGADDEYDELRLACEQGSFADAITLQRSARRLPNARDVFPEIVDIFQFIRPLVDASVLEKQKVERELDKFCDVSSDAIPLCVIGNCSAGKSTFINALIGSEILPSGDEPVTAKAYQIRRSKHEGRGLISFQLDGNCVSLKFDSNGIVDDSALLESSPVLQTVRSAIESSETRSLVGDMNKAIGVVNSIRCDSGEGSISDLVEVEVPFASDDAWGDANEFVIFDTPGSNSVSNIDHLRVLRDALDGFSNGLPIYVVEYDSLDSTDNAKLYDEVGQIDAMDERFAMIVVNKADTAALPKGGFTEADEHKILDQGIPRKLYAQGIYFVSSIIGLGAKTGGEFVNDVYAERFEDQERKYSNPDSRYYKMLYRYNILPGQIRSRAIRESENCKNLVFANSGMFCVEREIELFAERYSAYNKCHQSESLLNRIISITENEIGKMREKHQSDKANRTEALERDRATLVERLEEESANLEACALADYPFYIDDGVDRDRWILSSETLRREEQRITAERRADLDYGGHDKVAGEAKRAVGDNLSKRIAEAFESPSLDSFGDIVQGLLDDANEAINQADELRRVGSRADRETSDELLQSVRIQFDEMLRLAQERIDEKSQAYWSEKSEQGRKFLYDIATSSAILTQDKRDELASIIIDYPQLSLKSNAESIFVKDELMQGFKLWDLVLVESDKLNLDKLARVFNREFSNAFEEICSQVRCNHERSFKNWLQNLLSLVVDKITDYNAVLHNHVELIRVDTEKINDLTAKLDTLARCRAQVEQLLSWKE